MLSQKIKVSFLRIPARAFGGHHKPYDWRDDPVANPNLSEDVRSIGWKPTEYSYPYQHTQDLDADWDMKDVFPANYSHYDLSQNHRPENRMVELHNPMSVGVDDKPHAIEHLADYESEDCDFQPDTFSSQHFR